LWWILGVIFWEFQFNWCINTLGNSQHDVGTKHKENIIEEKEHQKQHSVLEIANEHRLKSMDAEKNTDQIIVNPTLSINIQEHLDA
jgi:hypothetical protein